MSEMADKFCTCGMSDPNTFGHRHDCAAVDEKKQLRARVEPWPEATDQQIVDTAVRQLRDLRARAERAEAELARQRPVVDAAEALVEYQEKPPKRLDREGIDDWLVPREDLIEDLAEKVKEEQRDG